LGREHRSVRWSPIDQNDGLNMLGRLLSTKPLEIGSLVDVDSVSISVLQSVEDVVEPSSEDRIRRSGGRLLSKLASRCCCLRRFTPTQIRDMPFRAVGRCGRRRLAGARNARRESFQKGSFDDTLVRDRTLGP